MSSTSIFFCVMPMVFDFLKFFRIFIEFFTTWVTNFCDTVFSFFIICHSYHFLSWKRFHSSFQQEHSNNLFQYNKNIHLFTLNIFYMISSQRIPCKYMLTIFTVNDSSLFFLNYFFPNSRFFQFWLIICFYNLPIHCLPYLMLF